MAERFARDDLYRVLGLSPGASAAEVTRAYRRQARVWHPDNRPGDPDAAARFREVRDAYEILSTATARTGEPPVASPVARPAPPAYRSPSWADPPVRIGPVRIEPDRIEPDDEEWPW